MRKLRESIIGASALLLLLGACGSSGDDTTPSNGSTGNEGGDTASVTGVLPVESSTPDTLPGGTSVTWRAGRDDIPDLTETFERIGAEELTLLAPDRKWPEGFRSVDVAITTAPIEDGTSIVRITVDFRNGDEKGKIRIAPRVTGNERERCEGLVEIIGLDGSQPWTPREIRGASGCVWDRLEDGVRMLNMQWEDGTVLYRATTSGESSDIVLDWLDEWVPVELETS